MGRLAPIVLDDLSDTQKAMMDYLRRGGVSVPARLAELVILITAREFNAQYAWYSHAGQAREVGLSDEVIEAIRTLRQPAFSKDDEALIYVLTNELLREKAISDATYNRALSLWGEDVVIDLVNLIGCYMMICSNLAAFQVDVPGGGQPLG